MANKNNVYIVTEDLCLDCNTEDLVIKAFSNKDDAIKYLHNSVLEYIPIVNEKSWFTELDEEWIFRACEPIFYHENHIEILITELEIE